jgi:hypothetical protein
MVNKSIMTYFLSGVLIFLLSHNLWGTEIKQTDIKTNFLLGSQITAADSGNVTCYDFPEYYIIARDVPDGVGTDFLIKYKSNPKEKLPCSYVMLNGDLEIKNEFAEYYAGLKKDLLILDSTTGPGPSGLIIWDLEKRKKVFEGSWSDPEESNDSTLVYWLETDEATEGNCPRLKEWQSEGLSGAIETKVILNLPIFSITKTKETRCSPRQ